MAKKQKEILDSSHLPKPLFYSFIVFGLVCIVVFGGVMMITNKLSNNANTRIGNIYMEGISEKNAQHFQTLTNLNFSELSKLAEKIEAQSFSSEKEVKKFIQENANRQEFISMDLYCQNHGIENLYGKRMHILNSVTFYESLDRHETFIGSGKDESGEPLILYAYPISLQIEGKKYNASFIGGSPSNVLGNNLFGNDENSLVYSYIINADGTLVFRSNNEEEKEYQQSFFELWNEEDSKKDSLTPEIKGLVNAINHNAVYSSIWMQYGTNYRIYETPLANSDWYLISVMPMFKISSILENMNFSFILIFAAGSSIVLLSLMTLFYKYYRYSSRQIQILEKLKREAEASSKAKSEFLSNMSHDIRTPMNGVMGMAQIALSNIDNKDRVLHCLKNIRLSSKHLLGLINDILDLSKIESGKMSLSYEIVSLKEVMDEIVAVCQPQMAAKSQNFDVLLSGIESEYIISDETRLNQVLLNLMSNAIKFTPEKGTIRLKFLQNPSAKGEDYIQMHMIVSDTGIGFSEEFKEHIFESFVRADNKRVEKMEGSGLGMAITKYIVDAMEGDIQIESTPHKGSTFHIILDLKKAKDPLHAQKLPEWNVLVVDDDPLLVESAKENMERIGLKGRYTTSCQEALELAKNEHFDFALIDWQMEEMDGLELSKKIQQLHKDLPVLLISAYDWSDIEEKAKVYGIQGFIQKPLFASTIYTHLLPYTDAKYQQPKKAQEVKNPLQDKRILVAEDNELNWEIASELLEEEGLKVEWAQNGQKAVEMFKDSPKGYYDAVLMDIRMPIMDGYQACGAIRALHREDHNLPIFAMTADAFKEDEQNSLKAGMNGHITKPIEIDTIVNLLIRHLKS